MRTLTRTIRVPVMDNRHDHLLSITMQEYSKAAQMGYNYGKDNNTTSRDKIHHGIYYPFRQQSTLNSQLVINAKNKGVDVLKSLKKKKKKPKVEFSSQIPVRYDCRSSKIMINQLKVSVATIGKRIDLNFEIPSYYNKYLDWNFRSFELVKTIKGFYLHLVVVSKFPP